MQVAPAQNRPDRPPPARAFYIPRQVITVPDLRRCRWCRTPIAFGTLNTQRLRPAHCANARCDWCLPCVQRREAAIAAGRHDLLEPVTAPPPETDCEQTREIPAVRDEIPPDQMT